MSFRVSATVMVSLVWFVNCNVQCRHLPIITGTIAGWLCLRWPDQYHFGYYYGDRNNSVCGRCSYSSGCRINSQLAIFTVTGSISPAFLQRTVLTGNPSGGAQRLSFCFTVIPHFNEWMNEWKCEDFKCVWKPTESRLCLTHYVNKSSRWAK